MNKEKNYSLIDGEYTPKQAEEILRDLYASKIQFHQMKNFSSIERFGKEDEISVKRIPQLESALASVIEVISQANNDDDLISICSEVKITVNSVDTSDV